MIQTSCAPIQVYVHHEEWSNSASRKLVGEGEVLKGGVAYSPFQSPWLGSFNPPSGHFASNGKRCIFRCWFGNVGMMPPTGPNVGARVPQILLKAIYKDVAQQRLDTSQSSSHYYKDHNKRYVGFATMLLSTTLLGLGLAAKGYASAIPFELQPRVT